jgi:D-aminopeptidase
VNVLIAADVEGIAGIEDCGDRLPSHPAAYARGRRLMTEEVLVAIEALRSAGVDRISVGDWHLVGTNIERDRMPEGVEVRPIADLALNEAEPSVTNASGGRLDAVVMLGHHASTPNPRAFCSHTVVWGMEVLLAGESLSEVRIFAQAVAAEGIPVLVACGDRWMLEELGEGELGSARLVATPVMRSKERRWLAASP